MPKLTLHIGTQKTGTSVLQEFFSRNRVQFARQGINYSLYGRGPKGQPAEHAHHVLAHYWAPGWLTPQITPVIAEKAWSNFRDSLLEDSSDHTMVVSSEHFYRGAITNSEMIAGIRDSLEDVPVRIVVYFRRPDSFALSNWAHSIKTIRDFRLSFADYARSDALANLLSYKKNLTAWRDIFGSQNVTVRIYDRDLFKNGNIIDDFLEIIGGKRIPGMTEVGSVNVSLSPFTLDFLHDLDRPNIVRYQQFVASLEAYAAEHVSRQEAKAFSPLTCALANEILDRFGDDYCWVSNACVEDGIDIDQIRPNDEDETYIPVAQNMKDLALALWHPKKTQ